MPYKNEHAARIKPPGQYERFTRKKITDGVDAILGIKDDKSEIQSYRFDKSIFSVDQAREWLKKNNIKFMTFEKSIDALNSSPIFLSVKRVEAFSQVDILKNISKDVLEKIKAKDPHPFFQAYSICHEGVSTPTVLEDNESKPIRWTRKAVQSIKRIFTQGVKFFLGHNVDNSTDNRRVLGEVVGDFQKEIDGKLHHVVISYHPPEVKNEVKKYDICSQEAIWNFFDNAGKMVADSIEKLTGIALANSEIDSPAFAGAKRLGYIQAFNTIQGGGPGSGRKPEGKNKDNSSKSNDPLDDLLGDLEDAPEEIITKENIQQKAITSFTNTNYKEIRKASIGESNDEKYIEQAKQIEEYIDSNKKYEGKIYRSIGLDDSSFGNYTNNDMIGAEIDMKGISSWTSDEKIAKNYTPSNSLNSITFKIENSSKGVDISNISAHPTEKEVIQSSKQRYKVKSISISPLKHKTLGIGERTSFNKASIILEEI